MVTIKLTSIFEFDCSWGDEVELTLENGDCFRAYWAEVELTLENGDCFRAYWDVDFGFYKRSSEWEAIIKMVERVIFEGDWSGADPRTV